MSLKYLKKKSLRDEVDFLNADKHESFQQGDAIIIDGHYQVFSKYSK